MTCCSQLIVSKHRGSRSWTVRYCVCMPDSTGGELGYDVQACLIRLSLYHIQFA